MKKIVLIILGCFMIGAMANATSSSAIEAAMTPPPMDAFNRLIVAGVLTQEVVDGVLDLYYNPGSDQDMNSNLWELFKLCAKVYAAVKFVIEVVKDIDTVMDWVDDNFEDHGCGTGYPVPSFTGGGLQ